MGGKENDYLGKNWRMMRLAVDLDDSDSVHVMQVQAPGSKGMGTVDYHLVRLKDVPKEVADAPDSQSHWTRRLSVNDQQQLAQTREDQHHLAMMKSDPDYLQRVREAETSDDVCRRLLQAYSALLGSSSEPRRVEVPAASAWQTSASSASWATTPAAPSMSSASSRSPPAPSPPWATSTAAAPTSSWNQRTWSARQW
jgi:hypothetical protein